jgi:hypothetical protein
MEGTDSKEQIDALIRTEKTEKPLEYVSACYIDTIFCQMVAHHPRSGKE